MEMLVVVLEIVFILKQKKSLTINRKMPLKEIISLITF